MSLAFCKPAFFPLRVFSEEEPGRGGDKSLSGSLFTRGGEISLSLSRLIRGGEISLSLSRLIRGGDMSESLWLRLGDWSALRDRDRLGGEASQSELSWRRRLGGDRSSSSDVSWRRRGEGDREPPGELSCRLLLGDRS